MAYDIYYVNVSSTSVMQIKFFSKIHILLASLSQFSTIRRRASTSHNPMSLHGLLQG
jgi:hypothetical protein